jgi:hypothetical protein
MAVLILYTYFSMVCIIAVTIVVNSDPGFWLWRNYRTFKELSAHPCSESLMLMKMHTLGKPTIPNSPCMKCV